MLKEAHPHAIYIFHISCFIALFFADRLVVRIGVLFLLRTCFI